MIGSASVALRYWRPCRRSWPSPFRSSRSCCCGYLAVQRSCLPESAIPGLNAFVLYFALPCMLFRFGASMPFAQLIDPVLIGVYAAVRAADGRLHDRADAAPSPKARRVD